MRKIVLIGAGGHALSVLDSVDRKRVAGFIDEYKVGTIRGFDILGNAVHEIENKEDYIYHIAIGDVPTRSRLYKIIKGLGLEIETIVDKTSTISTFSEIHEGCYIGKNVVIDADVKLEENVLINTGAIIEHGSRIGRNSNISTGAIINGDVEIERNVFVGSNTVCNGQLIIGKGSVVGSGAAVVSSVQDGLTVAGVPAKEL